MAVCSASETTPESFFDLVGLKDPYLPAGSVQRGEGSKYPPFIS